jgi:hypothetical protein
MSVPVTGQIREAIPADNAEIPDFNYIKSGVPGDIAVKDKNGNVVVIKQSLIDAVGIVPVGTMVEVMTTGTTADDIYVW